MAGFTISANTPLTPTIIAQEALMQLENELVMGKLVHRDYKKEFEKIGTSCQIRKPVKFNVTKSRVISKTDITESYITLNVATQAHVAWAFSSVELTMTIEQYSERYILPACIALANQMDVDIMALYPDVWHQTQDTANWSEDPKTFLVLGNAQRKLDESAVPADKRSLVLNPAGNWAMANAMRNMFVTPVSKPAITKGYLAKIANLDIFMDQNIQAHKVGNYGSSAVGPTDSWTGDSASYTQINVFDQKIKTTNALRRGDVFTIAGVYSVNPVSGVSTGQLMQFTVNADASANTITTASGVSSVLFSPPMIASGAYKTVSALPGSAAAITVVGNAEKYYAQNLVFHKNAFALVTVELEMPDGVTFKARKTHNGLSIRVIKDYDIENDEEIIRLDVLYGVKTLYAELACRMYGKEST